MPDPPQRVFDCPPSVRSDPPTVPMCPRILMQNPPKLYPGPDNIAERPVMRAGNSAQADAIGAQGYENVMRIPRRTAENLSTEERTQGETVVYALKAIVGFGRRQIPYHR